MKDIVYFIKLNGLSAIKIGKTSKSVFVSRISTFKTHAPYGIEILGVIETEDGIKLEKLFHKRFKPFRLSGEWFEISEDVVLGLINLHNGKIRQEKYNTLQRLMIYDTKEIGETEVNTDSILRFLVDGLKESSVMSIKEIADSLDEEVSTPIIRKFLTDLGFTYQTHYCPKTKVPKKGFKLCVKKIRKLFA